MESLQIPNHYPDTKLSRIPLESLVKLSSPNDPFTSYPFNHTRDAEVATLYSAVSIMSVHQINWPSTQSTFAQLHASPLNTSRKDETMLHTNIACVDYEDHDIAADDVSICARPDDVITALMQQCAPLCIVFGSPVSWSEKDRNQTGPRPQKTRPQVRSFYFWEVKTAKKPVNVNRSFVVP